MNRIIYLLILFPAISFSQAPTPTTKSFWADPFNDPLLPLYFVTFLVFTTMVLIMLVAIYLVKILNIMASRAAEEKAIREGRVYVPAPSAWESFWEKMNASVPITQEKTIELDHNYDGIRELDNHLPPWWRWLLYGTIAWSVVYMIMFHVTSSLPLSIDEYKNQLVEADAAKKAFLASQPAAVIDENALVYDANADMIAKGKKVFMGNNCQSCHRDDGGGNIVGPNLTDDFWIHGGTIKQIFTTIKSGVVEKGMPAWGKVMSPQDVRDVTFFIMSLRGTNPPNPKAPQGVEYKPEQVSPKPDTTITAQLQRNQSNDWVAQNTN
jgi:cytochrome c oxidase cbb3-type subunit III